MNIYKQEYRNDILYDKHNIINPMDPRPPYNRNQDARKMQVNVIVNKRLVVFFTS